MPINAPAVTFLDEESVFIKFDDAPEIGAWAYHPSNVKGADNG